MDALLRRRAMMAAGGGEPPTPVIEPVFYDRLVFDGTAYIDTDIVPPSGASFKVTLGRETVKATQRMFSCQCANGTTISFVLNSGTTTTNRCFSAYYADSSAKSSNRTMAFSTQAYSAYVTPKGWGYGNQGSYWSYTGGANAPTGGLVLGNNASHSAGQPYTGSMSIFRIYGSDAQNVNSYNGFDSYTPVYTLKPCTYNGEAGMWCVETSTFYGNTAGAGTLSVANNS